MKRIILLSIIAILLSCSGKEEIVHEDIAEIFFRLATTLAETRSNAAADGQYLYIVSVYVLDSDNKIVAAKENVTVDSRDSDPIITFDESYELKRGIYTLMAVANHANLSVEGAIYNSGLVSEWTSADYDALMNNMISTEKTDNISPYNIIQPLSLMKKIELHAGKNIIEGELIRTIARMRITVKNNSGTLPLKINDLVFSNNLTQKQAYVFDDGTSRKYFNLTGSPIPVGAPLVSSSHALQPFETDADVNYKILPAQSSAVVFDSYLLESSIASGEQYTYILDLTYDGIPVVSYLYKPDWATSIKKVDALSVDSESYFVMWNYNTGQFLSVVDNTVITSDLSSNSTTAGTGNVWQLISSGVKNSYYIKSVETGLYMQSPGRNSVSLGPDPVAFLFATKNSRQTPDPCLTIQNSRYISVVGKGTGNSVTYNVQSASNDSGSDTWFWLYPVNKESVSGNESTAINYNTPIVLTAIAPVTQQSSPVTAINRNDFINVLVTVSYNPVAGKFEFEVQNWNEGGGNVEFN